MTDRTTKALLAAIAVGFWANIAGDSLTGTVRSIERAVGRIETAGAATGRSADPAADPGTPTKAPVRTAAGDAPAENRGVKAGRAGRAATPPDTRNSFDQGLDERILSDLRRPHRAGLGPPVLGAGAPDRRGRPGRRSGRLRCLIAVFGHGDGVADSIERVDCWPPARPTASGDAWPSRRTRGGRCT